MLRHVALAALMGFSLVGCGPSEPKSAGGPAMLRRLTQEQYQNIITDVFGRGIEISGRFDPLVRQNGLLAVGAGNTAMTVTALDGYDGIARNIAKQVMDEQHRGWLVPCKPASLTAADAECARAFFNKTGRLLYRRALTKEELDSQVAIAADTNKVLGNFYDGLGASLSAMLVAPEFLYIQDTVDASGHLDGHAKASRLSFFLWNSGPDDALLDAAEKGELDSSAGLKREVDRLLASPRLEQGVRAFFADMYGFDGFETLQKDSVIYPAFGLNTADNAKEQTLRTIVDLLVTKNGDYRDLFTTRSTFVSGALGMIYHVSVNDPEAWMPYTFDAGDQHVGIQSHAAFQSLFSHPGRSSATIRGKAIRELFMCQKVPDPPANVDFTLVSDVHNTVHKTARERLSAHSTDPSCSGCHRLVDPIGLALENFDGAGQWRTSENGAAIDPSGEIDGVKYTDPAGLGKALHDSPAISSCVVSRMVSYAFGRPVASGEKPWVDFLDKRFASDDYKLRALMRRIALADAFYAVSPDTAKGAQSAAN